ncbi:CDP-diacylglycerol--glycerol-3-phosphate 3-phosphatidyltransferase [Candidatus Dependentiae bacterium]|nr:CDP-diacylglycerol--glycerol-3-phosphate 3-phosphatidyltransferase [Candidatus Dependentiae bacterium]
MKKIPIILTFLRILLSFVFIYFLFNKGLLNLCISIFIFSIAALTDFYDGFFARKFNVCSNFGKFLDPLADKVLTNSAFISFYFLNLINFWIVLVFLIRDLFMTSFRIFMWKKNIVISASKSGKFKTFFQFIVIYLLFLFIIFNSIGIDSLFLKKIIDLSVYFVVILTIWSAIKYVLNFKEKIL